MRGSRSPQVINLLESLQTICDDPAIPVEARLHAAEIAARVLGAKRKPAKKRVKPPATPTYSGVDLVPARPIPDLAPATLEPTAKPSPDQVLGYFRGDKK